jgi:Protein of unknown function (DUF2877)
MRIAALRIGPGVPRHGFAGVVAATHARACLIALTNNWLVTLVTSEIGGLPNGITVDTPNGFSFERSVSVGARAAVRGGMLRVDDGFCIDLRAARPWRSHLDELTFNLAREPVQLAWDTAWSALRAHGTFAPLVRRGGAAITRMFEATRDFDSACARQAMSALIGLGEGSTPAGDDYLVGHFVGLWSCASADGVRQRFVADLGESLREMASHTNRVSRVYLEAAVEGEVSERLTTLVCRIAAGAGEEPVAVAAAAALAVGHSSGACAVLGLLLASAAWGHSGRPAL